MPLFFHKERALAPSVWETMRAYRAKTAQSCSLSQDYRGWKPVQEKVYFVGAFAFDSCGTACISCRSVALSTGCRRASRRCIGRAGWTLRLGLILRVWRNAIRSCVIPGNRRGLEAASPIN
jgi:hypothetical protein